MFVARRHAGDLGLTVLAATGVPALSRLPFAGLHQLLRPGELPQAADRQP